jgi:GNAT superfamily N-acetyltransferase
MPITKASVIDVPELNVLVNNAYRGEESKKGWTSEADMLDGLRIDEDMLKTYFENEAITILKHTDDKGLITGCVYLEVKGSKLYLGMFSVSPVLQGKGVGRGLLEAAEELAKQFNCNTITMTVISTRAELISWYERRGYAFTGEMQPFHAHGRFGNPKQLIELIVMEKAVV